MTKTQQFLAQLPGDVYSGLQRVDSLWKNIKENTSPDVPVVIKTSNQVLGNVDWDVVICGGTLGVFIGAALAVRGWRVALIERGILRGREQEWNVSRQELEVFLELDLLTQSELNEAIATEYNPARVRFFEGKEVWIRDVLNIGVDPVFLLEKLKKKFLDCGGYLLEDTAFKEAVLYPDGVVVEAGKQELKGRLLMDAMGHFSPIIKQARQGEKPDGICLVVGSCAKGFAQNETGDLLVSFTPILHQCQYFWEAFPARDGRTTYLFTYLDAEADRFSLEFLFEEYLRLLPQYQNVEIEHLNLVRALFGFFPSYRQSPVQMPWDRVIAVGDSSGCQSPLSFGGFGAMLRHLQRLTVGVEEALKADILSQNALALLQPYQPSLSVTWLFQKAMTVGLNQKAEPQQINRLLSAVFAEMEKLGEPVLKPFLQDVVQFSGLSQTLLKTALNHPKLIANLVPQLGIMPLVEWMGHYVNLGVYTGLFSVGNGLELGLKSLPAGWDYYMQRRLDGWKFGSGSDHHG
ncbi:FAD-binding oxidoreductase [Ancylothrix sp. C2]|uniref:FAD-binding oxidoreductase n=1 Tax=Ancylothrix sp. D3o TaxID=2953691 RepID=UPI0021BA479F|nr:FAD-binding oxidoreductase [Ancylothrix sp. D3o]MCT7948345.1 FAD-binding oxidoreductase [Ancylothrix sp. D3o]